MTKIFSMTLSATLGMLSSWSGPVAAYCLDDLDVGMFTEREFTELEAPPRFKAQDKRLNALLKRGMQATGANLVSIDGRSKEEALKTAAGQKLAAFAYLQLEAVSREGALAGPIVDISSTTTLQILAVGDGQILGEGSDIAETPGINIEDALPDILTSKMIETLAGQAEKAACRKGIPSTAPIVAEVGKMPAATGPSAADRALTTKIQHALISAGYDPGLPDGMMGHQTSAAIKQAEMKLQLPPTGEPSALLAQKLIFLDRSLISNVQKALYDLGRTDSRPTGVLDGKTQQKIEEAEFEFELSPPDGLPDNDLLRVLRAKLPRSGEVEQQVDAAKTEPAGTVDDPGLRLRIEELLVQLNYFAGPASGIDTIDSQEAIWKAERDLGLKVDGVPDKELWRLLDAKVDG